MAAGEAARVHTSETMLKPGRGTAKALEKARCGGDREVKGELALEPRLAGDHVEWAEV